VCEVEDGSVLENIEVSMEEACAEETSVEPLVNAGATSSSSAVYQIVTNADGSVSLVGLDSTQLDQLFNVHGTVDILYVSICITVSQLE